MGCQCCRMLKSYIYDPTAPVESHHLPGDSRNQLNTKQNQGFHNLGFSNKYNERGGGGSLKLEIDNNHINRLHAVPTNPERERGTGQAAKPRVGEGGGDLYILHPEGQVPRRDTSKGPSLVRVYPSTPSLDYSLNLTHSGDTDSHQDKIRMVWNASDLSIGDRCGVGCNTSSADELDEGVGDTPEDLGDTGDEQSVQSADIQTCTTSLSSADTNDNTGAPDATTIESGIGISVKKSEDEGKEEENDDVQSVTDSMVAEALAALEAATAGEDYED